MLLRWTSVLGILAILARLSPVLGASPMDVTYLYMGIQIGSVMDNHYLFQIQSADFSKTECKAHKVSPNGRFVNVARTLCDDGSLSFQFTFGENMRDGGTMEVWYKGRTATHYGTYFFPGDWFQWVSSLNVGSQENYVGKSNFTITNVSDRSA